MKDKQYGICEVRFVEEKTLAYVEYYTKITYNDYGADIVYICKDLITGTRLNTIPLVGLANNIYDAAKYNNSKKLMKRGHLIVYGVNPISKEDMIEILKSMGDVKIKEYVDRIEKAKFEYLEAIKQVKKEKNSNFMHCLS